VYKYDGYTIHPQMMAVYSVIYMLVRRVYSSQTTSHTYNIEEYIIIIYLYILYYGPLSLDGHIK